MLRAIVLWYALMSAVTVLAFAKDRRAARLGRWRTRERTLHLLSAAGGVPGTLLAIRLFRHKSRSARFLAITFLIALAHAVGWINLLLS
ncbi:MAG: DUF1294 domain-containing protein [Phycisphaeraceae bacterium]|nr:DUF1294 domain-containing protein [Phycisphaeraceae bacterium]